MVVRLGLKLVICSFKGQGHDWGLLHPRNHDFRRECKSFKLIWNSSCFHFGPRPRTLLRHRRGAAEKKAAF